MTIPPGPPFPERTRGDRKANVIVRCYTGAHDKADEVLRPIREFGARYVN